MAEECTCPRIDGYRVRRLICPAHGGERCGDVVHARKIGERFVCVAPVGHDMPHRSKDGTWWEPFATPPAYPAGHGYTPSVGPFGGGEGCRVMLARYPCNYTKEQHDPDLPPVDLDVFGYRRQPRPRCCPGAGTMAHVRGCVNHPEVER